MRYGASNNLICGGHQQQRIAMQSTGCVAGIKHTQLAVALHPNAANLPAHVMTLNRRHTANAASAAAVPSSLASRLGSSSSAFVHRAASVCGTASPSARVQWAAQPVQALPRVYASALHSSSSRLPNEAACAASMDADTSAAWCRKNESSHVMAVQLSIGTDLNRRTLQRRPCLMRQRCSNCIDLPPPACAASLRPRKPPWCRPRASW